MYLFRILDHEYTAINAYTTTNHIQEILLR